MCLTFLYYYPRHNIIGCHSEVPEARLVEFFNDLDYGAS